MKLALLLAIAGLLVAAPSASALTFFKSPSGNVVCQTATKPSRLLCAVLSERRADGSLPQYELRKTGRSKRRSVVGDPATDVPVLAYGKRKRLLGGAVVCLSLKRGMTCDNEDAHGFELKRGGVDRF